MKNEMLSEWRLFNHNSSTTNILNPQFLHYTTKKNKKESPSFLLYKCTELLQWNFQPLKVKMIQLAQDLELLHSFRGEWGLQKVWSWQILTITVPAITRKYTFLFRNYHTQRIIIWTLNCCRKWIINSLFQVHRNRPYNPVPNKGDFTFLQTNTLINWLYCSDGRVGFSTFISDG